MYLVVYSPEMTKLGIIDAIDTLIWTRRFRTNGEMALKVPFSADANELLKNDNIVMIAGRDEAMQITYINIVKDTNGIDTIEAQGQSLLWWLNWRYMEPGIFSDTMTAQAILNKIVSNVMGPTASDVRKIDSIRLSGRAAYSELSAISYKTERGVMSIDAVEALLGTSKLGVRVVTDAEAKTHTFDFFFGRDLTDGSDEPCIFSVDFGNLGEQSFTQSTQNLKTVALVSGDGNALTVNNELAGMARRELYVAAGDISEEWTDEDGNKHTITFDEMLERLRQRGREELEQNIAEKTFTGEINRVGGLQYLHDFDIGDKVTCIDTRWGVKVDTTITEIMETYQNKRETVTCTFGDGTPSLINRVKQLIRR